VSDLESAGTLPPETGSEDAEDGEERSELAKCLRPMIEQLGKDYWEALKLVELEGLTQQDAARRIGLSISGMKSRVQRGRRQLRQMLMTVVSFSLIQGMESQGMLSVTANDHPADQCN